jgi:opacity protein-like surface antigen
MLRKISLIAILLFFTLSLQGFAQDKKIEVTPYIGYTFSEGVDVDIAASDPDDTIYLFNRISPTSGMNWGVQFDYLVTENFAIGFNYADQSSTLEARVQQGEKIDVVDQNLRNYHGIFTYNLGDEDSPMRPFFFGGLGATQYATKETDGRNVDGGTRFSTTWGGGVKMYFHENVGIRGQVRWTPTYIKSDAGGWWCGWYGCWVLSNPNYSNQLEMSAGVVFRF